MMTISTDRGGGGGLKAVVRVYAMLTILFLPLYTRIYIYIYTPLSAA